MLQIINKEGLTQSEIIEAYEQIIAEYIDLHKMVKMTNLGLYTSANLESAKKLGQMMTEAEVMCSLEIEAIQKRYAPGEPYERDMTTDLSQDIAA